MTIMDIQKTTIESGVISEGFNKIKFKPASLSGIRNNVVNVPFKKSEISHVTYQASEFEVIDFYDKVGFDNGYTPIKVSRSKFNNIKSHNNFSFEVDSNDFVVENEEFSEYEDLNQNFVGEEESVIEQKVDLKVEVAQEKNSNDIVDFDSYLKSISETSSEVDELKKNALAAKKEADLTSEELKNVEAMNNSMKAELEEAENKAREIDRIFYERVKKQERILNAKKKEYVNLENQSTETKRYNERRIAELGNQNDSMSKRLEKLMESTSAREKILAALEEINEEMIDYSDEETINKKIA